MKLVNNSDCNLCHQIGKDKFYLLEIGKVLDVPKEVADIWLKYQGVSVKVDETDIEAAKAEAVAQALKKYKEKEIKSKKTTKTSKPKKIGRPKKKQESK